MSSEPQFPPNALPSVRSTLDFATRIAPRAWVDAVRTARRDAAFVLAGFAGTRPPPFTTRRAPAAAPSLAGRPMRVARLARETPDAVTLELADPSGTRFDFVAGQFVTVVCSLGGREYRRAYSLSSSPLDAGPVAITVKRVRDGAVSNHLNDRVREGDTLHILGPSGNFTLAPEPSARRDLVLIAGGSGITPVISIARTVLRAEPGSRVALLYGNRSARDVIFADALASLAREHSGRFTLREVLSDPPDDFQGTRGVLDAATLASELDALGPRAPWAEYYVCGPEGMMASAREVLTRRGVPTSRVREERFTRPQLRAKRSATSAPGVPQRVSFGAHEVSVASGQTLLEAGLSAGVAMEFSCAMGGCGACRVKLAEGEVEMEEPNCLSPEERAQGYVLACVSRPLSRARVEAGT